MFAADVAIVQLLTVLFVTDEARESGVGVLVHCLAGISRSVTITVAYLMFKKKLSLEAAYDYVRVKKANIDPNFNFMGQLKDFQVQLNLSPQKCSCIADCRCRHLHFLSSPDSGIEFDRYS
ncbi:hypothetical protein HAZT_HAZT001252 [Hyalella azteca]|uniref:protein-tyrosine-phosphatase n=1 Tax=Hyalella azteca TaxID=294128 RepID=A0A6A0GQ79_HYAAZ|nr:hypothetical protein HAZT_HAZT001252 [Hyalella azteca]